MKKRNLTSEEQQLLRINKGFHQQRLEKGFNWKKLGILISLFLAFVLTIYFLGDHWLSFIAKWGVVIIPIALWSDLSHFRSNTKQSMELLQTISELEQAGTIHVLEYHCTKAIKFDVFEDEGICHAMQVGKNELLLWWDNAYEELQYLPNTRFEIFLDEKTEQVFGRRVNILGDPIQPTNIRPEVKWDFMDQMPGHREVINSTVDQLLADIEAKYSC